MLDNMSDDNADTQSDRAQIAASPITQNRNQFGFAQLPPIDTLTAQLSGDAIHLKAVFSDIIVSDIVSSSVGFSSARFKHASHFVSIAVRLYHRADNIIEVLCDFCHFDAFF